MPVSSLYYLDVYEYTTVLALGDIFACLLDLSLVEEACLSKVTMLKQGKLSRHIFS